MGVVTREEWPLPNMTWGGGVARGVTERGRVCGNVAVVGRGRGGMEELLV